MRVNEQGRSMIEMLGVLAIVGVLSVGGIAGYSKAMNKFKTNKMTEQVTLISTNIRTLYSSQKNYAGLNNKVAVATGVIPGEMYDATKASTSDITNAFGGKVKIASTKHMVKDDSFVIATGKIPAASCVSIATTDWGGDSGSGLLAMTIEAGASGSASDADALNTAVTSLSNTLTSSSQDKLAVVGDSSHGLPFGVPAASSSCKGDSNVIAWKYL